ncbi:MAG: DUF4065 domain-containing protein [Negativicutes bacterium]|uniref:Panacea domain-containing protein n=1 Tax=Novosphingobium sp. Fuku2-ISO-50 TaxID=1739114 RepID=UPI00076C8825|nr:type II toxin-antitoxin system antitoxin SocA domain-containing protein [Novosphingobium sp. Fuku2-ISO-50]KUR71540.1 hypothetical protein AQZ50_19700 [Novosphingobium sp. Fuku2-ISO-50]MDR3561378.1 DUF4065 domain-containing protein [Negativicutes bacterium]
MADARIVANKFLELAQDDARGLTPMQVLKLVYIAHGWSLGIHGRPLIEQSVQAWQYGPVIPDLYHAMKGFGGGFVAGYLPSRAYETPDRLTGQEARLIEDVYRLYGHMTGIQLSRITHAENTPWSMTYEPGSSGEVIPADLIAEHYRRLAEERAPRAHA